jgi:hypothetical protein
MYDAFPVVFSLIQSEMRIEKAENLTLFAGTGFHVVTDA